MDWRQWIRASPVLVSEVQQKYFLSPFQEYPHGTDSKSVNSGVVLGARYDSRDNWRNAERGVLLSLMYGFYPAFLGSTHTWHSVLINGRVYWRLPLPGRHVLALQAFSWMSFGDVPYFELPALGEEFAGRSGRGYYQGRYRGQHMLYSEVEYRVNLWRWLGAAGFFNIATVTEPDTGDFEYVIPGGGGGLRFLINRPAKMSIALDVGVGKQGSHGVYLNVNEAF